MKPTTSITLPAEDLATLAAEINRRHRQGVAATQAGLENYHAAGVALLKAKKLVAHGEWQRWLAQSCPGVSLRTCQRYMALAREWDPKNDTVSFLETAWERACGRTQEVEVVEIQGTTTSETEPEHVHFEMRSERQAAAPSEKPAWEPDDDEDELPRRRERPFTHRYKKVMGILQQSIDFCSETLNELKSEREEGTLTRDYFLTICKNVESHFTMKRIQMF
jgi:hypothetical protein